MPSRDGSVGALSARTGVAAPELVKAFGHHLLSRFTQGHVEVFARSTNVFDFVASIDGHIHVEGVSRWRSAAAKATDAGGVRPKPYELQNSVPETATRLPVRRIVTPA